MRMIHSRQLTCALVAFAACGPLAALAGSPVIVEGIVPDEALHAAIIERLHAVYGDTPVMDRIEVGAVTTPANWSRYATQVITRDLKDVSSGELRIDGNAVRLQGKVADTAIRSRVQSHVRSAFNPTYDIRDELAIDDTGKRQDTLDRVLANRTVQFESGSATLTAAGRAVLDDMAAAIVRVGTPQIDLVGHTDGVGDRQANVLLSVQRADVAKAHLALRGIDASRMTASGRGPDLPIADNATAEGRARNRRIEFVIRQP